MMSAQMAHEHIASRASQSQLRESEALAIKRKDAAIAQAAETRRRIHERSASGWWRSE